MIISSMVSLPPPNQDRVLSSSALHLTERAPRRKETRSLLPILADTQSFNPFTALSFGMSAGVDSSSAGGREPARAMEMGETIKVRSSGRSRIVIRLGTA